MAMIDLLLPEYDHEVEVTRRLLERLPDDRFGWTPHPKSMSLGGLASHVGMALAWISRIVGQTSCDVGGTHPRALETRAAVLAVFEEGAAAGRAALAGASDAELLQPWCLKKDGQVLFTTPRIAAIRTMVMNHMIHHRGQLSVYLRLNDVPLPAMYGPSADERL